MYVCMYIYIYRERERQRENNIYIDRQMFIQPDPRERDQVAPHPPSGLFGPISALRRRGISPTSLSRKVPI